MLIHRLQVFRLSEVLLMSRLRVRHRVGRTLKKSWVQVEYIARVCFTSRWPLQKKWHCTVCYGVLWRSSYIISTSLPFDIKYSAIAKTGIRGDILKWCRVACGRTYDYWIIHCSVLFSAYYLGNSWVLLSDCDIYADYVFFLLVDYRIDCYWRFTCLSVADYKLTLSTSYREHRVYCRDTCLREVRIRIFFRLHRGFVFYREVVIGFDWAKTVYQAPGIDYTSQSWSLTPMPARFSCSYNAWAFQSVVVASKKYYATAFVSRFWTIPLLCLKFDKLSVHCMIHSVYAGYAVSSLKIITCFGYSDLRSKSFISVLSTDMIFFARSAAYCLLCVIEKRTSVISVGLLLPFQIIVHWF